MLSNLRRSSALALVGTVLVLGSVEDDDRGKGCDGPSAPETTNTVPTQFVKPANPPPEFNSLRTTEQQ
jgi:hypothetical protein